MTRQELIEQAAIEYCGGNKGADARVRGAFLIGAEWADEHPKNLWHNAQGDDLPEIDREVIVLCDDCHGGYKVCFGHRPHEYVTGVSYDGKMTYMEAKTYGKGGWNIPDVKWWLDCVLPNKEEKQ